MFLYPQFMKYSTTIYVENRKAKGENVLTVKTKDMSCDYLIRVFAFLNILSQNYRKPQIDSKHRKSQVFLNLINVFASHRSLAPTQIYIKQHKHLFRDTNMVRIFCSLITYRFAIAPSLSYWFLTKEVCHDLLLPIPK